MKLSELAEQAGVSVPTIKFWLREGLLPRAPLKNARTAAYGQEHVERAALIRVLRGEFDASLPVIRTLTEAIDTGERIDLIMQRCQSIASAAWSVNRSSTQPAAKYHSAVDALCEEVGWPNVSSLARDELAAALDSLDRHDVPFNADDLAHYAKILGPVAASDVDTVSSEGSVDMIVARTLLAIRAQVAVLVAVNQLAHTSIALARTGQP